MVEIFDNIRKIYQFSAPCEALKDYVEFFSESSAEATHAFAGAEHFSVKMFASYTPTFWINLGVSYQLAMGDKLYNIPAGKDILVVRNDIVERLNHPADHLFSIKFYPGGLEAIFGINQSQMIDRVIDLHDVLPASLLVQVRQLNGFEERMKLLQDHFLQCLARKKQRDHYLCFVQDAIIDYENGNLRYNVNEMAARMFTTSRTINRYFNDVVGASPKNYFSILRARTALTAYVDPQQRFTPETFGYYDMSHFYKEVLKFTGEKLNAKRKAGL
ncbi:MAG: helix-turn-helix domain-containing protein [Chitinophagaceae bacterium]